jgi:hypothetical protein
MTGAERLRRYRERQRGAAPARVGRPPLPAEERERRERERQQSAAAKRAEAEVGKSRRIVDARNRILVPLPANGERIYFDDNGREIDEPPTTAGRTSIDHRGRIVEELPYPGDTEMARMYGITVEEWRKRHP